MGNRKQNLKKQLGISEYPWSSDEDEPQPIEEIRQVLQIAERDSRPSVAEMPGTSGTQPQSEEASPATTRKMQDKLDRDLFWSIINNTPGPSNMQNSLDSRMGDRPAMQRSMINNRQPPLPRPSIEVRAPERQPQRPRSRLEVQIPEDSTENRRPGRPLTSQEIQLQRMLAFKKLTRSLQDFVQQKISGGPSSATNSFANSSSSRASRSQEHPDPAPSSASGQAPTTSPPAGAPGQPRAPRPAGEGSTTRLPSATTGNRSSHFYRLPLRRPLPSFPITNRFPTTSGWYNEVPLSTDAANGNAPGSSHMPDDFIHVVDHSEDEAVPNEGESSGARLIEEVVEVDMPDVGDNNPPPPGTEGEERAHPAPVNLSAESQNANANVEPAQPGPSYQGVKRKRESQDEAGEPFTVHEFNQNLLRLLECPVCLEWMEPPISQCRRGHLVCSRCRARLAACPVCRTPFSSVRNRAMEGVAEMLRYPCRHGCGREVRLRRRVLHEASCAARHYACPAPACARSPGLPREELARHFQVSVPCTHAPSGAAGPYACVELACAREELVRHIQSKHLPILKIGCKHKFTMKMTSEQHDTWLIMALDELFHVRVDVDMRTFGIVVYVAYIGPKKNSKSYLYEVNMYRYSRKLVFTRSTHSDLDISTPNVNLSRYGCFHLIPDQAYNFIRTKNRHGDDKLLDFEVIVSKWEGIEEARDHSDS